MRDDLPPELTEFVAVLDAQPGPVQAIFQYCLAMLMVEAGRLAWPKHSRARPERCVCLRPSPAMFSPCLSRS